MQSAGQVIAVEVQIDNPDMVQDLIDDWEFKIYAQIDANTVTSVADLREVEESLPPAAGLVTNTLLSNAQNSMSIAGT